MIVVDIVKKVAEILCVPAPHSVRRSKAKKTALQAAFDRRIGDPNQGGTQRSALVTSYRQEAQRCASYLLGNGASKGSEVAKSAHVRQATRLMADNYHGWFQRVAHGVYDLTLEGREAAKALAAQNKSA